MKVVTKESLAQWIAELESQPHLSLREERYLAVMKRCQDLEAVAGKLVLENAQLWGRLNEVCQK